jgi:hypothetical protein
MLRFCPLIILAQLLLTKTYAQQEEPLILDDSVSFDTELAIDDDIFGNVFDEDTSSTTSSWFEGFTVRINQQFSGQVNNHAVEPFPGFSFPREPELETNRLGINVRYQNAFAPGWLLQASGQGRIYLNNDYEYRANKDHIDTEFRINEFFLQRSFSQESIKFGRQTVVWGETVGNSVLDVINHSEFRDLTIIDIEDARLNQWMVVWDHFGESSNLSSFINLYPEFNPAAVRGSPFFFEPPFNLTDYDRESKLLFEAGTQWKKSFEGSDIAFMAAYLYENQLLYEDPVTGIGDAVAEKNDFILLGFSANKAIGKLLLNFDFAFSHDVLANSFDFPGTSTLSSPLNLKKDQIGTSFGFEYAVDNEQSVSLGIQVQKILDAEEGLLPGQTLVNEGTFGSWLVRYSNTLLNSDLVLSSTLQGDLEADSLLALLGVNYTINDNWAISGQIISINANADSPLVFFAEDLRIGTTITYSF